MLHRALERLKDAGRVTTGQDDDRFVTGVAQNPHRPLDGPPGVAFGLGDLQLDQQVEDAYALMQPLPGQHLGVGRASGDAGPGAAA